MSKDTARDWQGITKSDNELMRSLKTALNEIDNGASIEGESHLRRVLECYYSKREKIHDVSGAVGDTIERLVLGHSFSVSIKPRPLTMGHFAHIVMQVTLRDGAFSRLSDPASYNVFNVVSKVASATGIELTESNAYKLSRLVGNIDESRVKTEYSTGCVISAIECNKAVCPAISSDEEENESCWGWVRRKRAGVVDNYGEGFA